MLKALYALALALLVVAFVGFGVSDFYPEPEPPDYPPGYPQELESVGPEPTEEEKRLMAEQREEEEVFRERLSGGGRREGPTSPLTNRAKGTRRAHLERAYRL